jgi:hypothetical protein
MVPRVVWCYWTLIRRIQTIKQARFSEKFEGDAKVAPGKSLPWPERFNPGDGGRDGD